MRQASNLYAMGSKALKCKKCCRRHASMGRWYVMTNVIKKSVYGTDSNKVVWICREGHVRPIGWTKPLPEQKSVVLDDGDLSDVMTSEDVDE